MAEVLISNLMIGNCSDRLCAGSAHAQIYPPLTDVFKPLIKEGNVYNVSYIQIKKANRMYKHVDNDIMIGFTKWILCCLNKPAV
ncbi:hypothetical protein ZEAMMB73_Zm00001d029756 [Zea mays]|uniref:Uncharacterized protein n=1 Tax=Zea mays TaxID=4577 RepID=A0A1D6K7L6_MAIZE|nr:hypothetical protein ZEAMMB73_Zm00001d029756 [Zea mays]